MKLCRLDLGLINTNDAHASFDTSDGSSVWDLSDETLMKVAHELTEKLRKNVRANLRQMRQWPYLN